ncbi:MAG: hypothetical protein JKY65_29315, partial [Planctomycetes bacterium]|nr:hypothetical protein [Planctomycetota bacterium]
MSTLLVPWSTTLVVLPAVTALVTSRLTDRRRARTLSVVSAGIGLALAVGLLLSVFGLGGERALLADPLAFAPLGPRPLFGLDLISAPLVVLVGLTTLACVWGTPANEGQARTLTRIMALQAATLAALVSLHAELFAVAWLLTLVPVVLELRARGATRMAKVFLLYQGLGWFALAIAFWSYGGAALFDGGQQGAGMEVGLLVAVVLAAAARQGLLPFHSWLPSLHEQVPPGITALTFVPQLGGYLLVRLLAGSPGAENLEVLQVVVVLGAATAVYAALLGVIQTDLRRSVGWLAVSQSALVMCGLAADGSVGLTGGLLLCGSSGLALTGLLLTV